MPDLVPVDHDPFSGSSPNLVPVDHDPFGEQHKFGLADTWPAKLAKAIYGAVTLPGDVYSGETKVDVNNPEFMGRVTDLASMSPLAPAKLATAPAAKAGGLTAEDLVKAGSDQFNQARGMDLAVKPDFAKITAQDMRSAVETYDPEQIRPVLSAINRVDELYKPAKQNLYNTLKTDSAAVPVPMNEVELARKQLSSLRTSPDASLRTAAKAAQEAITKNQMALRAEDAVSGDAPLYAKTIADAVGNYAAGKRGQTVQGKIDLGELNAGTAGVGANEDNALRQAVKQLARPVNNTNTTVAEKLGFKGPELDAIKRAAMGTPGGNLARYIGKTAPTGIVSGAGSVGIGHLIGGPIGGAVMPVVGYAAKKIGDRSTKRAVSDLESLVLSRSPLARLLAAEAKTGPKVMPQSVAHQALTRALVSPQRLYVSPGVPLSIMPAAADQSQ